jgi:hypothetical protein
MVLAYSIKKFKDMLFSYDSYKTVIVSIVWDGAYNFGTMYVMFIV